ncbi:MAG: hypothetical protein ACXVIC_03450 [Halobacteriota archaeon]
MSLLLVVSVSAALPLCAAGQTAHATTSPTPTASPTPTPTASPTLVPIATGSPVPSPSSNQTNQGGVNQTLLGAGIIGVIAVALMIGFYYTTRRM